MLSFNADSTELFQADQRISFEVQTYDTPFLGLSGDEPNSNLLTSPTMVPTGGLTLDVWDGAGVNWEAVANSVQGSASITVAAATLSASARIAIAAGRTPTACQYWAGGSQAYWNVQTPGAMAVRLRGTIRSQTGRRWAADSASFPLTLGIAGCGWVRISVTGANSYTRTVELSERGWVVDGYNVMPTATVAAGDVVDILYMQRRTDAWGGFVVKACCETVSASTVQAQLAAAPVFDASLADDDRAATGQLPAQRARGVQSVSVTSRRKEPTTCQISLPLTTLDTFDGTGWVWERPTTDSLPQVTYYEGGVELATLKTARIVQVWQILGNERWPIFTGYIDAVPTTDGSGEVQVQCSAIQVRVAQQYDRNLPDPVSYMMAGFRQTTPVDEPVYAIGAYDAWPLEKAIEDILVRAGATAMTFRQPLPIANVDGTTTTVTAYAEPVRKLRARSLLGRPIKMEQAPKYGNGGVRFIESRPADDPYLYAPDNTRDLWARALDLSDRFGFELSSDAWGHFRLESRRNALVARNFTGADPGPSAIREVNPSALAGSYMTYTASATAVTATVSAARVDLTLPRALQFGNWRVRVYEGATVLADITVIPESTNTDAICLYDNVTDEAGQNATVVKLWSGAYRTVTVQLEQTGTGKTLWALDALLMYAVDPDASAVPVTLDTQTNAFLVEAQANESETRNAVTLVGRRTTAATDSQKFEQARAIDPEYVVERAVDFASITDPTAPNFLGQPHETVIYDDKIADQAMASYLAASFMYRYRAPQPGAAITHSLLPVFELRDPVRVDETVFNSVDSSIVRYVEAIEHTISTESATTRVTLTAYPDYPSFDPREDIDIDAEFDSIPVINLTTSYTGLSGTTITNPNPTSIRWYGDADVITTTGTYGTEGGLRTVRLNSALPTQQGQLAATSIVPPWPPVPGTVQVQVDRAAGASTTLSWPVSGLAFTTGANGTFTTARVQFLQRNAFYMDVNSVARIPVPAGRILQIRYRVYWRNVTSSGGILYQTMVLHGSGIVLPDGVGGYDRFKYVYDPAEARVVITRISNVFSRTKDYYCIFEIDYAGQPDGWEADTPYQHLTNVDYRTGADARVELPWIYGDSLSSYTFPSTASTSVGVRYRALVPALPDLTRPEPYPSGSPIYDPYSSELGSSGSLVTLKYDALVSGQYRVAIRSQQDHTVVAWLTAPDADPEDADAHWQYQTAGRDKTFRWDGVDQVGLWNAAQSAEYARWAQQAFEQNERPTIGRGFYAWNEENVGGARGRLACLSTETDLQGKPVWGQGTIGSWYVTVEVKNDRLAAASRVAAASPAIAQYPRLVDTRSLNPTYNGASTSAYVFTHLGEPTRVGLLIRDWTGAPVEFSDVTALLTEGNWGGEDADSTIHNNKPIRLQFESIARPGTQWDGLSQLASVRLVRQVHLRANINDQTVVYTGTPYPGSGFEDRRVVSRRLFNDNHTVSFEDSGFRSVASLRSLANPEGTSEWVFFPRDFKKDFDVSGIEESIEFGNYLQLEEVPSWTPTSRPNAPRSNLQLALMHYAFFLSAYTQDRSGRYSWVTNDRFLDRSKILRNNYADWPDRTAAPSPGSPLPRANSSTYRTPVVDDPNSQQRRTIVTRQWTDEPGWQAEQRLRYEWDVGSLGDRLLRHYWKDHDPNSTTLAGVTWPTLDSDEYSRYQRDVANDRLRLPATFPLTRQLGLWTGAAMTSRLDNVAWSASPAWAPCITRDFHGYYRLPPMVEPKRLTPANAVFDWRLQNTYGFVDHRGLRVLEDGSIEGDDAAASQAWSSAAVDQSTAYSAAADESARVRFVAGTSVTKDQFPSKIIDQRTINYLRQDETLPWEALRGFISRGTRPGETPVRVEPQSPYYHNTYTYDAINSFYDSRSSLLPRSESFITSFFSLTFRSEYVWESASLFPTFGNGGIWSEAANVRLTRYDTMVNTALKRAAYDGGGYIGWKDDRTNSGTADTTNYALSSTTVGNVFTPTSPYAVVAVGPRLAETTDAITHLVLVPERSL